MKTRTIESISWAEIESMGEVKVRRPSGAEMSRLWQFVVVIEKAPTEAHETWFAAMSMASPYEVYIHGGSEVQAPVGVWILQSVQRGLDMGLELRFVQDEGELARPIRRRVKRG